MGWLTDILTGVLALYLALTGALAEYILVLTDDETAAPVTETVAPVDSAAATDELSELPTEYEAGGSLPDILIDNAAYQQAAVVAADPDETTTTTATRAPSLNRDAIVNLRCTHTTDEYIRATTGTGFMVSPNGVILTNAHVAFFLLLRDIEGEGETQCVVNTGRESAPQYEVDLLYIPPAWIQENANLISSKAPKGTGERDFALLYVTEAIDGNSLPTQFPHLSVSTNRLNTSLTDDVVTVGGYPAEEIVAAGEDFVPLRETATTTVTELFTFGSGYADVINLAPTTISQHGISGGPVVDADNQVIGLISTKSDPDKDGLYGLNAISLSYIDRTISEETGFGFAASVRGDLPFRASIFRDTLLPFLTAMVADEL
jgi:V8-like Glu-specific endopeptidase